MGELKDKVIALLKDPSEFDTYDKQANAIIGLCMEEAALASEKIRDDDLMEFAGNKHAENFGRATANDCAVSIRMLKGET